MKTLAGMMKANVMKRAKKTGKEEPKPGGKMSKAALLAKYRKTR